MDFNGLPTAKPQAEPGPTCEDIDGHDVRLGVAVLSGLRGRHLHAPRWQGSVASAKEELRSSKWQQVAASSK